jgi:hypothetical protein
MQRPLWSFLPGWRRVDLRDPAQAIGFGIVWTGYECSADLCGIPSRCHAEAKRLFNLDMTRREILHRVLSLGCSMLRIERTGLGFELFTLGVVLHQLSPARISKHRDDQIAMMSVGRRKASGIQDVTHFSDALRRGRRGNEYL